MNSIPSMRLTMIIIAVIFWTAIPATAAQVPDISKQIPQNVCYAVFVSNFPDGVVNLDSILARFKTWSPELDLKQQGEKLKATLGFNLLSADGLQSMGIDPSGTGALFSETTDKGVVIVIPLKDPTLFKTKLFELIEKESGKIDKNPRKKMGAEIYSVDDGFIGFKGSTCVLQPEPAISGEKDRYLMEFFKAGKKLATVPRFKQAISELPESSHVMMYLDMKKLDQEINTGMKRMKAEMEKALPPDQKKTFMEEFNRTQESERKFMKTISFVEGISMSFLLKNNAVEAQMFLASSPAGIKTLKKLSQAQTTGPGFHQGLSESSVLAGWLALNLKEFINTFGSIPLGTEGTLKEMLLSDEFKKTSQIDIIKDLLEPIKGPVAIYLLQPGTIPQNAQAATDIDSQIMQLIRIAWLAQLSNPKQINAAFEKFKKMFAAQEPNLLQNKEIAGVPVSVLNAEKATFVWGIKGNTAFLTLGESTAEALIKVLPDNPWGQDAATGQNGAGQLDFAILTESISTALNKGIGGPDAQQFKLTAWPMVQSILSKFGKWSVDFRLSTKGLLATSTLNFR